MTDIVRSQDTNAHRWWETWILNHLKGMWITRFLTFHVNIGSRIRSKPGWGSKPGYLQACKRTPCSVMLHGAIGKINTSNKPTLIYAWQILCFSYIDFFKKKTVCSLNNVFVLDTRGFEIRVNCKLHAQIVAHVFWDDIASAHYRAFQFCWAFPHGHTTPLFHTTMVLW